MPCQSHANASAVDLCFFHSQSYVSARDTRFAEDIILALDKPPPTDASTARAASAPRSCFGAVRFLAARIPLDVDVYTIYPTHNFTGPNTHFLSTFVALERISALGLARYAHFQILETDTYAFRPGWADALALVVKRRRKEWVLGSRSMCLRPTEIEHVNGNALYSVDRAFVHELRRELSKRLDSWAFDVLIGHWLFRKHPRRIAKSAHVLSISTFQRNRSCCELVRSLVRGEGHSPAAARTTRDAAGIADGDGGRQSGGATAWPSLYLLHTGNIGKLRDSTVPPSMRALGLSLQDLFVPRSDEPCVFDSALPAALASCHSSTQPWRARLKGQGDCRPVTSSPTPLLWVPTLTSRAGGAARSMLQRLRRTFALRVLIVSEAESVVRYEPYGDDGTPTDDAAPADVLVSSRLSLLLAALPRGGIGQLVALLQPPSASLWREYRLGLSATMKSGQAAPGLSKWLLHAEPNPTVAALTSCSGEDAGRRVQVDGRRSGGGGAGGALGGDGRGMGEVLVLDSRGTGANVENRALEVAKAVLQDRSLSILLTRNTTQRSLTLLERFFGWQRRELHDEYAGEVGRAQGEGEPEMSQQKYNEEDQAIPTDASVLLKAKLALDARLYEFAARLADEQYRSVVWVEDDSTSDACSVAEAAGEVAAARRVPPTPLALEATMAFTWDGDGYHVYELTIPPQRTPKSVTLLLRGKSVIGSSSFTVNIFVSHRTPQPSFAERTFRYMYESYPPHRRAGKFVLSADRLRAACVDLSTAAGESGASAACGSTRPLTLWIAFKCRSVAVSQLTFVATQLSKRLERN